MPVINRIADFHAEMAEWRHRIHAHPETAFEEHKTAELVSDLLQSFGIQVDRGFARTGVIGTLKGAAPGGRAIALRADMDALPIEEQNQLPYASNHSGRMHACGHDGHTAMLLGAAKHLAETRNFAGTIYFIFQPAEENEGGARLMIEEGVLEKYPIEAVYGMMAAEDFAWFLEKKPGAYIWIGNGDAESGAMLHNPHYDFNDKILPLGASYWVRLAKSLLSKDNADR